MYDGILARLRTGHINPLAIGVASFVATIAMILSQPGAGVA